MTIDLANQSLLPPSVTPLERDLEATAARLGDLPTPHRDLWNEQACPVALLPWLAWAVGVDEWRLDWSEAQKRSAIADALALHRRRGTPDAVTRALAALPFPCTVMEWFDQVPRWREHEFGINIELPPTFDGTEDSSDIVDLTLRLVRRAKNLRSHLARVRISTARDAPVYVGAATTYGATFFVLPAPPAPPVGEPLLLDDGEPLLLDDGEPLLLSPAP